MNSRNKKWALAFGAVVVLAATAVIAKPLIFDANLSDSVQKPQNTVAVTSDDKKNTANLGTANANEVRDYRDVVINVTSGDIRPILALAAEQGSAQGVFVGKVGAEVRRQFGNATVMIKAVRAPELLEGCPKILVTIYQVENPKVKEELTARACPKKPD